MPMINPAHYAQRDRSAPRPPSPAWVSLSFTKPVRRKAIFLITQRMRIPMSVFSLLSWFRAKQRLGQAGRAARSTGRATKPRLECLEDRYLLSGASISGFVYHDANHNGL